MPTKTTWGAGDYPLMAAALEPVSALAVDAAAVSAGDRVIDVATGTGNAALQAAARGATVLAVDTEPSLLALARDRAVAAGALVEWLEGDAQALPARTGKADVVVSVFGVMYARDHARAARELVRVLAPAGRIVLAAWTPGSLMPTMGLVVAPYLPAQPAASGPPSRWGDPDSLSELLNDAGARLLESRTQQLFLRFDDVKEAADFLIRTAGHIVSEEPRITDQGRWQALQDNMITFVAQHLQSGSRGPQLQLEYLLATATHA